MSAPSIVERSARIVVDVIRTMARRRVTVSFIGLGLVLAVALGYIMIGSLGVNPARSTIALRVLLPESGGLLPRQDVTLRGVPIGRVQSVVLRDGGVMAIAAVDSDVKVPVDSAVRVSALSPAGEQYLDIRPSTDNGPYLRDGDTFDTNRTSVPVPFSQLVGDAEGALNQLDPEKIAAMTKEFGVSKDGPQKLAAIVDGGTFMISTLDSVLPQTISALRNSRTVLTTFADVGPGLTDTTLNLNKIMAGVNRLDGGYRTLVETGTAPLTELDKVIADNSDTMVQLLGNLTTIAQLAYVRVPALNALFPDPSQRGSIVDSLLSIIHDGAVWGIADPYPRYSCDYNLPPRAPSQADFPEPYRHTYCANPDPSVLIRGARNAPRPPGDDTATPPPGYDPLATTDPTPIGLHTIPTPYGGPDMSVPPPN